MPDNILGRESISISEYVRMPNVPQPYIVEGMIYEHGKAVVVGKPKFGKSHLALRIGMSAGLGQSMLNLNVVQCPVVLLEFDRRYLLNQIHEISGGQMTDMMHVIPAQGLALNEFEGYRLLLAAAQKYSPKDGSSILVIIDHKSACFAGKENEDAPNKQWIANLDKVAKHYPVSYLVICQAPKSWKGDIADLPIGSRILAAWADTIVSIQKPNRQTRKIEMASNYGEIEPITYTKDFQIIGSEDEETKLEIVMTYIQEHWDEFVYPNISKKVEESVQKTSVSYSTAWSAYNEVKKLMEAKKRDTQEADEVTENGNGNTNND